MVTEVRGAAAPRDGRRSRGSMKGPQERPSRRGRRTFLLYDTKRRSGSRSSKSSKHLSPAHGETARPIIPEIYTFGYTIDSSMGRARWDVSEPGADPCALRRVSYTRWSTLRQ